MTLLSQVVRQHGPFKHHLKPQKNIFLLTKMKMIKNFGLEPPKTTLAKISGTPPGSIWRRLTVGPLALIGVGVGAQGQEF